MRTLLDKCFIAGWEYYDGERALAEGMKEDDPIALTCEPENEYDSNAIAVYWYNGKNAIKIGFVPRASNGALALLLDRLPDYIMSISAQIVTLQNSSNPWKRCAITVAAEVSL